MSNAMRTNTPTDTRAAAPTPVSVTDVARAASYTVGSGAPRPRAAAMTLRAFEATPKSLLGTSVATMMNGHETYSASSERWFWRTYWDVSPSQPACIASVERVRLSERKK